MTQVQIVKKLRALQKLQSEKGAELLGQLEGAMADESPDHFLCELCRRFKHTDLHVVIRWGKSASYCRECKEAILSRSPFTTLKNVVAVCIKQDELVSCDRCHSRAMKDGHLCLTCGYDTTPVRTDRETETAQHR